MLRNKILALAFSCALPVASFAGLGTETSGGGDAVVINNQLVIRDLVSEGQLIQEHNMDFLKNHEGFKNLMFKIGKVHPFFASRVLADLLKADLYMSPQSLPLLPYGVTTISGKGADVQVAIRDRNTILFAPEFELVQQSEYVLLHEALHGLLDSSQWGPDHHQRVRNIVKYIHDRVEQLKYEDLDKYLLKNGISVGEAEYNLKGQAEFKAYVWNRDNHKYLRCWAQIFLFSETDAILSFEDLDCEDSEFDGFLRDVFPEFLEAVRSVPKSFLLRIEAVPEGARTFDVVNSVFMSSAVKESRKITCRYNQSQKEVLQKYKDEMIIKRKIYGVAQKMIDEKRGTVHEKQTLYYILTGTFWDKNLIEMFAGDYVSQIDRKVSEAERKIEEIKKIESQCLQYSN